MFYGLTIEQLDDGSFQASSRDIPECVFVCDNKEEVRVAGRDAIPAAMELFYRKRRRPIPLPTPVRKGEIPYRVPVRVQAKILFWNHLIENGYRVSDVAKKLSISQTQAQRYVDLTKDRASMDAVEEAMEAFGIALTVYVDD